MPESKSYKPLEDFLKSEVTVTLSYTEIETILGFELPPSAYKHSAWWDNNTHNHYQMWSWANAGWAVVKVDLGKQVTLRKVK